MTSYSLTLPTTPLFGTDGIRGKVGDLLYAELALSVGFWAGQVLKGNRPSGLVIMGQDSRNSSDMLASALAAGLTQAGLEVWNLGLCPTAGVAHLTANSDASGGIMISASHNPPGDNGIKFFGSNGLKLAKELQAEIEAGIRGQRSLTTSTQWGKHYYVPELVNQYVSALQESLGENIDFKGLKIILDLAYGASVKVAPEVFTALGAEVICLHEEADGDRINVNCGSTHLGALQKAIQHHTGDIGFAFDGDADRVMAIDSQGRIVDGDYILYFWGKQLREEGKLPNDLIISTVMANLGFERAWKALGGKFVRTAVGDQYVQAEMINTGAMLGGEQSGHILSPQYSVSGDGILTALHLGAIVKNAGKSLTQMVDESFSTYPQVLKNIRVDDRQKRLNWQNCDPLMKAINQAEIAMGDSGRVLVRASGTEPLIRVMVEAENPEMMEFWANELVSVVEKHFVSSY